MLNNEYEIDDQASAKSTASKVPLFICNAHALNGQPNCLTEKTKRPRSFRSEATYKKHMLNHGIVLKKKNQMDVVVERDDDTIESVVVPEPKPELRPEVNVDQGMLDAYNARRAIARARAELQDAVQDAVTEQLIRCKYTMVTGFNISDMPA